MRKKQVSQPLANLKRNRRGDSLRGVACQGEAAFLTWMHVVYAASPQRNSVIRSSRCAQLAWENANWVDDDGKSHGCQSGWWAKSISACARSSELESG